MSEGNTDSEKALGDSNGQAGGTEDPELDDILDSALPDFDKYASKTKPSSDKAEKTSSQTPTHSSQEPNSVEDLLGGVSNDAAKQFEDAMKDLMDNEPQLMQQFEQLFQAAGNVSDTESSQQHFASTLQQTLGSLSENTQELGQAGGEDSDILNMLAGLNMGDLEGAMGDLGGAEGESGEEILPLMQSMMKTLMSKEVLYPSLKEISNKYPVWIEENKANISSEDLVRYQKQLELMSSICNKFDEEKATDSEQLKTQRFGAIMQLMQEMQDCGQPPKEIVGEMAPGLEFDQNGVPKVPGMEGCSIM